MRMERTSAPQASFTPVPTGLMQRKCAACGTSTNGGDCKTCASKSADKGNTHDHEPKLQRSGLAPAPQTAPAEVNQVLRSSGQQIDTGNRQGFESSFGTSFANVRVHTDARAAESAEAVNAQAYTVGQHIVFGAGQYAPGTASGRHLIAHELAHTMQQGSESVVSSSPIGIAAANTAAEAEASRAADQFSTGQTISVTGRADGTGAMQRLGDITQVPPGMSCPVANTGPPPALKTIGFDQGGATLTPAQQADIATFIGTWQAAGGNATVRVDGYASVEGPQGPNWTLSCSRAAVVAAELNSPATGTGIPSTLIEVFAHGETQEFSGSDRPPNRVANISMIAPVPPPQPVCAHPGVSRTVDVQPVFFRTGPSDSSPTGGSFNRRLTESNTIWDKLGVTFNASSAVTLDDATNKTRGSNTTEYHQVRATHSGSGVEVFVVDNDMSSFGGGGTVFAGTASAQIVMSDRGTSDTLLAHELGHVLGLGHPPSGADANTIMTPSSSNSSPNPTRNTIGNFNRITFPAGSGTTCLNPDP